METADRLHHLLGHWVEHNEAHAQTYLDWAERAAQDGLETAAQHLREAVRAVEEANRCLLSAAKAVPSQGTTHGHS